MTGLVLLGPPGVGKGTQAERLRDSLGLLHLSTGEILRRAVAAKSPLGQRVAAVIASGNLVSDELVGEVVDQALRQDGAASKGFVLDGFPRTLGQVGILDRILEPAGLTLDHAVLIEAPQDLLVRRLTGRRICPGCSALYHVDGRPPSTAGVCNACGARLVQRDDDREEVVTERLRVYRQQTTPVIAAYRERGLLREIDGSGSADEVFARVLASVRGVAV